MTVHDLAVIVVSIPQQPRWLTPCLSTLLEHAGPLSMDVVVAANEPTDGARELVEREFPGVRVVECENRGFAHANNRALVTCDARYVLFLNPDTQIVEGSFAELVDALDARPEVGLAGVRQVSPDGSLLPTIRRFPTPLRALGEAFAAQRLAERRGWLADREMGWLGERELRPGPYERETRCDWTPGSFMLARGEAIDSAGLMDERFFLYAEDCDLCYRIKRSGWEIVHMPAMTILHHAGKGGVSSKTEAQAAFARLLFARKHFVGPRRIAYVAALFVRHLLRSVAGGADPTVARQKQAASRRALRTLLGLEDPPYGQPPPTALASRDADQGETSVPSPSSAPGLPARSR